MNAEPKRDLHDITVTVNGDERRLSVESRHTLADVLREQLGLTGTHLGCEHGVCGACTVLVDGAAVRSCLVFGVQVGGSEVETVEGLAGADGQLAPLQQAFLDSHGLQCGFCTPGFLMLATAYLREEPEADATELRDVLASNLCRCTGYQSIAEAVSAVITDRD